MRRSIALLLLVGTAVAMVPPAQGKPGRRELTYFVVAGAEECALSTNRLLRDSSVSCSHEGVGRETSALGNVPIEIPAIDGVPVTLDVRRAVQGQIAVHSTTLVSYFVPLGAGEARVDVRLTGVAGGKRVVVGETTTEAYLVTPATNEYRAPFTIEPDEALAGVKLEAVTLEVAVQGPTVNHPHFPADASSEITLPLARPR